MVQRKKFDEMKKNCERYYSRLRRWGRLLIKGTYVLIKTFVDFSQPQILIGPKKIEMTKDTKSCNILGSKTSKNDFLTLISGLPTSFITLSTWRTTKRGSKPLMELNAR